MLKGFSQATLAMILFFILAKHGITFLTWEFYACLVLVVLLMLSNRIRE